MSLWDVREFSNPGLGCWKLNLKKVVAICDHLNNNKNLIYGAEEDTHKNL